MPISSNTVNPQATYTRNAKREKKLAVAMQKRESSDDRTCAQRISSLDYLIKAQNRANRAPERGIRRKFADMMLAIARRWDDFSFSRQEKARKKLYATQEKLENTRKNLR